MQDNYESIMIMHVKKASVVQASLDIGRLTFPGLVFFFLVPRQQNNSLDSDENLGHSYIYIYIHISITLPFLTA